MNSDSILLDLKTVRWVWKGQVYIHCILLDVNTLINEIQGKNRCGFPTPGDSGAAGVARVGYLSSSAALPYHPVNQCMSLVLSWAVPPAGALGVIVRTQGTL